MQITTALAAVSLAVELGFRDLPVPLGVLVAVQVAALALYVIHRGREIWRAANRWITLRRRALELIPIAGAAAYIFVQFEVSHRPIRHASTVYIAALSVFFLLRLGITAIHYNLAWSQSRLHPARLLTLSFAGLVLLGGVLLSLPKSTHPQVYETEGWTVARHVLNCFFTSASATCVTGLTVYDTGSDFTRMGQVVILGLIQLGGLGIMIFGSVLGLLVRRHFSLRQSLLMQDATSHRTLGDLSSLVTFIVVVTLIIEAIGAVCMHGMWQPAGTGPADQWFHSVFHSVSAFCNAGFGLHADSLTRYRADFRVYACLMPLIVIGGIGFPVLFDLWGRGKARIMRALGKAGPAALFGASAKRRLSLHTRVVLTSTVVLVVGGTVTIFVLETCFRVMGADGARASGSPSPAAMYASPTGERALAALFQSVTCRTAGFNTVPQDLAGMSTASHFLSAILMFIGGSPASTAGGVKTTALAIIMLAAWSTIRGRDRVEAFGRTIPHQVVHRAGVIIMMMFAACSLTVLCLSVTEHAPLREILYESVSACGTVGLSTGLTPKLSDPGRVVVLLAMFAGRLGPLTVMVALAGTRPQAEYDYPREDVIIG